MVNRDVHIEIIFIVGIIKLKINRGREVTCLIQ